MLTGLVDLDPNSPLPMYRQLYAQIRAAILDGRLASNHRLPATRPLADALGISRNTVKTAFEMLQMEGYLESRTGAGTVVVAIKEDILERAQTAPPIDASVRITPSARSRHFSSIDRFALPGAPRAFQPGLPAIDLFPHKIWGRLLARHARRPNLATFGYAFQSGLPELKSALAEYLLAARGVKADPEQIVITPSSQACVDLVTRILLDPGETVWMEDPGYIRARTAFIGAGANLVPVAVDAEGIVVAGAGSSTPKLIYVTPSHQCPTGVTMSLSRRLQLLETATTLGATILEDDYDSEIRYDGRPITALQGLGGSDRVIYIGTFSKTMMPGIRAGYLVAPKSLISLFEAAQRYTGQLLAAPMQAALAAFVSEGHHASHIRRMRDVYRERRDMLVTSINSKLGGVIHANAPPGGLQLSVALPKGINDQTFSKSLLEAGVASLPLSRNYVNRPMRGLVLGFAAPSMQEIQEGVLRLSRLLLEATNRAAPRM